MAITSRFSRASLEFYEDLEEDNTKAFWHARKSDYDQHVLAPMRALIAELEPEFGTAKLFRPHRDVRFSADKSPYKTHQGAYVPVAEALGWYVQLSADGLQTGGGFYAATPARLAALRAGIVADGSRLRGLLSALGPDWTIGGDQVRTAPRGYARDHPNLDLLRHKTLYVSRSHGRELPSDVTQTVRSDWQALSELVEWLDAAMAAEPN